MFALFGFTLTVFVAGTGFVFTHVVPVLQILDVCGALICIFLLGPLAVFRKARPAAAIGFLSVSYLFFGSIWMLGFVVLQARDPGIFAGVMAIIISFATLGIYVPVSAIAEAARNGAWETVAVFLVGIGFAFCTLILVGILDRKISRDALGAPQ
jgi:hypothetical protein